MMNDSSIYALALSQISGIGNVTYKRLINRFGSAQKVFDAGKKRISEIPSITADKVGAIVSFNSWESVKEQIKKVQDSGVKILSIEDKEYPQRLKKIYDLPPVLYLKGDFAEVDKLPVAVVGSRHPSTYGSLSAERIASGLARKGITVVSGMAMGIDSKAHRTALNAGGRTIAVLGSGIDVIYPSENKSLYSDIIKNGVVMSEFSLGTRPEPSNFPRRNRIISGLSLGVVVVEATEKSGALITAKLAIDQNREVFAVPGNIDSARSQGTNKLIQDGAKLIESVDDIMEELKYYFGTEFKLEMSQQKDLFIDDDSLTDEEKKTLVCLSAESVHIDTVIEESGFRSEVVSKILLDLELKGLVKQIPGKNFVLN